jgi:transcriptional regulator with XRE-family HTH domain
MEMTTGTRILVLMRSREPRLRQRELAERVGVTQSHVSSIINGAVPSVPVLQKLADALNTSTDYLLGRADDPAPARNVTEAA